MKRRRLPVLVRCQHLLHDHLHRYTCAAMSGQACEPITQGPDLSSCPRFATPPQPSPVKAAIASDDDDLTEYCPCAGVRPTR